MTLPPVSPGPLQPPSQSFSRFGSLGRLVMATLCVSLVSFASGPKAQAAGADGTYEFREATGSLKIDGDRFDLPKSLLKRLAGFEEGEVIIEDNTLIFKKNVTAKIVEEAADEVMADVEVKVTGPNKVVLTKSGSTYSGSTTKPVIASFDGEIFSEDFSGELRTRVAATVEGKTLTIVIRFSGTVDDEDFSGKVTLVAKR
ncbi:MAG: hypothetical protein H7Y36_00720 [Armatimonadetes bacterium]|nr:hypothetical protein [Akkermansiaceae bacterium]